MKANKGMGLIIFIGFLVGLHSNIAIPEEKEVVIHITAKKFEFKPNQITIQKGIPVVLEIEALDRKHGFKVADLGLDVVVKGGETQKIHFVPEKLGTFPFHCSAFCGSGHEDMKGAITVVEKK
jgi:cytochrome c oxidase subunit 2